MASLTPSGSATGNPRNKTALKPGHSLMDWIRVGNSGQDLTGVGGKRLEITPEELAKHNKKGDAWMAIRGQVYNVSAYMDYHPGGEDELMRGVGIDATELFDEVHQWVNYQTMLTKCHVGKLITTISPSGRKKGPVRSNSLAQSNGGLSVSSSGGLSVFPSSPPSTASLEATDSPGETSFAVPASLPFRAFSANENKPRFDWFQSATDITLSIFCAKDKTQCNVQHEDVVISCNNKGVCIKLLGLPKNQIYIVEYELEGDITPDYKVRVSDASGKVDVVLTKTTAGQWSSLGKAAARHDTLIKTPDLEYHECSVVSVVSVSHDTFLYKLQLPPRYRMMVPLGHHVYVQGKVEDMDIVRAYTVVPPSMFKASKEETAGAGKTLHLIIKLYEDGALTNNVIRPLKTGSSLAVSTLHAGTFSTSCLSSVSHLVLVAAGTGFTPMAGLIQHTLEIAPQDRCKQVLLLFFNKTEEDILWHKELDKLTASHKKFSVTYIFSQPSSKWSGPSGRINKALLEKSLPKPGKDRSILLCACGPTAFTNETMRLAKEELSFTDEMLHAFLA